MLPEKMAFWNSLVSSLTEPEPAVTPTAPPTTKPVPVTIGPTGQKEAVASKSKNALAWPARNLHEAVRNSSHNTQAIAVSLNNHLVSQLVQPV